MRGQKLTMSYALAAQLLLKQRELLLDRLAEFKRGRNEGKHLLPASDVVKTESPKMNSVADVDIETAIKEIKENVFVSKEIHSLRPINGGDIGSKVTPEILIITV